MGSAEEAARRQAVARVFQGESPAKIAADLGRTERWVRKWVARYDPANEDWFSDRSRAPVRAANRTVAQTEQAVLEIRKRLMADPWAQVGSGAIAWEMTKLGLEPPLSRTTERILARAGAPKRRSRPDKYVPKGTPYPVNPALLRPNAVHEIDLVGPRHLEGAVSFHSLNAVDLGRRKAAIEVLISKSEREVAYGLVAIWSRLGIPELVKFDNGRTLQGTQGHLALPVRLALTVGARVRFIPFGEPWRNGVIEHFNDVFDKRFFRAQRFSNLDDLKEQAGVFEMFHNSHHRYTALKGATPDEFEKRVAFDPGLLDLETVLPTQLPVTGQIEFIRLIRSDRTLKVLDTKIQMPEELIHRYVTATLDLSSSELKIEGHGCAVKMVHPFKVKP